jgi:hypothetical protein
MKRNIASAENRQGIFEVRLFHGCRDFMGLLFLTAF